MWGSNLDNVELGDCIDRGANFMLKSVHLKAHALENYFSACVDSNLFEYVGNLRSIQRSRWH